MALTEDAKFILIFSETWAGGGCPDCRGELRGNRRRRRDAEVVVTGIDLNVITARVRRGGAGAAAPNERGPAVIDDGRRDDPDRYEQWPTEVTAADA